MNIVTDKNGNEIFINNHGVQLQLSKAGKRWLGTLNQDWTVFFTQRNRAKHLHRLSQSYAFNYMLINALPKLQTIIFTDEHGRYKLPVEVVKQGNIRGFTKINDDGNQYELQYFVPLSVIEKYEVK